METNCCLCVCLRPRTAKRLVSGLFPNNYSGEKPGTRPQNVKRLTTYAVRYPKKLPLIGKYFDQRIRSDLSRRRLGGVLLAVEGLRALLVEVRLQLNSLEVLQDRVLPLLLHLLRHESPLVQAAASQTFACFAAGSVEFHACALSPVFPATVGKLIQMTRPPVASRPRYAALRTLVYVVTVADAHTLERYVAELVPQLLANVSLARPAAVVPSSPAGDVPEEKLPELRVVRSAARLSESADDFGLAEGEFPVPAGPIPDAARLCLLTLARRVRPLALGELLRPIFEAFDAAEWAPLDSVVQLTRDVAASAANPAAVPVFLFLLRRVAESNAPTPRQARGPGAVVTPGPESHDAQQVKGLQRKAKVFEVAARLLERCPAAVSVASWQHETIHFSLRSVLSAAEEEACSGLEPGAPQRKMRGAMCRAAVDLIGTFVGALRSPLDRTDAMMLVTELSLPALMLTPGSGGIAGDGGADASGHTPARRRRRSSDVTMGRRTMIARRWFLEAVVAARSRALGPASLHDRLLAAVLHLCVDPDPGTSLLALKALRSVLAAPSCPSSASASSSSSSSSSGSGSRGAVALSDSDSASEDEKEAESRAGSSDDEDEDDDDDDDDDVDLRDGGEEKGEEAVEDEHVQLLDRERSAIYSVVYEVALRNESPHHTVVLCQVLSGLLGADPVKAIADGIPLAMALHDAASQPNSPPELFALSAAYLLCASDALGCDALGQYVTEVLVERQTTGMLPHALTIGARGVSLTTAAPRAPSLPGDPPSARDAGSASPSASSPAQPASPQAPRSLASSLMASFHVHAAAKSRRSLWLDPQALRRCLASLARLREAYPEACGGLAQLVAARTPVASAVVLREMTGALDTDSLASAPALTELDAAGDSDDEDEAAADAPTPGKAQFSALSVDIVAKPARGPMLMQNSILLEEEGADSPPPSPTAAPMSFAALVNQSEARTGRLAASLNAICDMAPTLPTDVELTNVSLRVDHAGPGSPMKRL